eukprot:GHVP01055529.1.p1 GENE.GHVP01055529.1~~GHVP01055529.1.p1  ORF type:complete len:1089 (+),score=196.83 GHVP01055529.1:88-3267(+)
MEINSNSGLSTHGTDFMDLYSRQIGAIGVEAMSKLVNLRILIHGLDGLGVEIAKNVILTGPECVVLHDNQILSPKDLSSNFCISQQDIDNKLSRASGSLNFLSSLNEYVKVRTIEAEDFLDDISSFSIVILCNASKSIINKVSQQSRKFGVKFICCHTFGLASSIFVDFGDSFTIFDEDGRPPTRSMVTNITNASECEVSLLADKPSQFKVGDLVKFTEVNGMTEINQLENPARITKSSKFGFTIDLDTTKYSLYTRDGFATQVKEPKRASFDIYSDFVATPNKHGPFPVPDMAKFGRPEQLHFAFQAVLKFQEENGCLPKLRSSEDALHVVEIAKKLNEEMKKSIAEGTVSVNEIDPFVISKVALFAEVCLGPMSAFTGGVVSQEILKLTGKGTPIRQALYFDAFECLLPEELTEDAVKNKPASFAPARWTDFPSQRMEQMTAIWGREFVDKLMKLKIFVVGAGALGCEALKFVSLLNASSKEAGGLCHVVDLDSIEVSNLNRQFLFRREHVGKMKSQTACEAVSRMNPDINTMPVNKRLGEETENYFDDAFWDSLDIVVNALDNIPSRLYVDSKCVWHEKPLLESGTLGSKCNVQVCVPHLTQSYGDTRDPPEESIPLCTLRHFPNQIEHTIEWSRDWFEGFFTQTPQEFKLFLSNESQFIDKLRTDSSPGTIKHRLEKIIALANLFQPGITIQDIAFDGCEQFTKMFNYDIAQLLHNFPFDHKTSDGSMFWSGPKREPEVITYSSEDPAHVAFVYTYTALVCFVIGKELPFDTATITELTKDFKSKPFEPKKIYIRTSDEDTTLEGESLANENLESLVSKLKELTASLKSPNVSSITFEKDDDRNNHIDFIAACANLRARNYRIPEAPRHEVKIIAGKIIPAMATTTAATVGLVGLEFLKLITKEGRKIEDYKNCFCNLDLPLILMTEPSPSVVFKDVEYDPITHGPVKTRPTDFTPWMKTTLTGKDCTLKEVLSKIEAHFAPCEVAIMSIGVACIYNSFSSAHRARLDQNIKELYEEISGTKLLPQKNYLVIEVSCCDPTDQADLQIPPVKFVFR